MSTNSTLITEQILEQKIDISEKFLKETLYPLVLDFKKRNLNPKLDNEENQKKNFDCIEKFNQFKENLNKLKEDLIFLDSQQKLSLNYDEKKSSTKLQNMNSNLRRILELCNTEELNINTYIKAKIDEYDIAYAKLEKKFDAVKDEVNKRLELNASSLAKAQDSLEIKKQSKDTHIYATTTDAIQQIDARKDTITQEQREKDIIARNLLVNERNGDVHASYKKLLEEIKSLKQSIEQLNVEKKKLESEQLHIENTFKNQSIKLKNEHIEKQFQLLANPAINQKQSADFTVVFRDCVQVCGIFTKEHQHSKLPDCITPKLLNDFLQNKETDELMIVQFLERSTIYSERLNSHKTPDLYNIERIALQGYLRLKNDQRFDFFKKFGHDLYPNASENKDLSQEQRSKLREEFIQRLTPDELAFLNETNIKINKYKEDFNQFLTPAALERHLKSIEVEINKFDMLHSKVLNQQVLNTKIAAEQELKTEQMKNISTLELALKKHEYIDIKNKIIDLAPKLSDKYTGRRLPVITEEQRILTLELDSLIAKRSEAKKNYDALESSIKNSPEIQESLKQYYQFKRLVDFAGRQDGDILGQRKAIVGTKNEILNNLANEPIFEDAVYAHLNNKPIIHKTPDAPSLTSASQQANNISNESLTSRLKINSKTSIDNSETSSSENSPLNSRVSSRAGSTASSQSTIPGWVKSTARPPSVNFSRPRLNTRGDTPTSSTPNISSPLTREIAPLKPPNETTASELNDVFNSALPSSTSPNLRSSNDELKRSGTQSAWCTSPPHSPKKWEQQTSISTTTQNTNITTPLNTTRSPSTSQSSITNQPEVLPKTPSNSPRR